MNPSHAGLIAIMMWSCAAIFVALADRIPAFQLMGVTWLLSTALLIFYNVLNGRGWRGHWSQSWRDYLFVLVGIAGNQILYYFAFKLAPPFEANTLNYLWPIILIVLIDLHERKRPDIKQLAGMALGFAGCALLLTSGKDNAFANFNPGHLLAIGGACIWALYSAFAKTRDYPSGFMVPIFLISTLIFFIGHFAFEDWVAPTSKEWLAIAIIGIIDTAYVLWDFAIRRGNRTLLTSLSYLIPLFSTVLLIVGGFGAQSPMIFTAGAMVIGGCLLVNAAQILKSVRK
jgi:drug/metabolite transporter (DMT)-like permease